MEEWKEYKLGEVCTKIGSGATPKGGKESYLGGNISLIRSQNVLDFTFSNDGLAYISDEQATKLKNVEVKENDVLLNITGDSVARACIVPNAILPARVNQHVAIIRGNESLILNKFILYALEYKKQYLLSISQGGGTRNALTKKMIEDFVIKLPHIETQQKIANILSSLDDKIEVNRRINEQLEELAQALFKSWFVDFEPFKDGKFVESELGMIPEGCTTISLSKMANYLNGLAMQKYRPLEGEEGLPVLKIKELGQDACNETSELCSPSLIDEKYIVDDGDVIFSWSGTLLVKIWCGGTCGLNQHLFKVTSEKYPKWYVYLWTKFHLDRFIRIAKDKAVTMGHIKRGELDTSYTIVLNDDKMKELDAIMSPIIEQFINNNIEIRKLATLRDTLLPKLMSGEIDVNEVEI